MNYNDKLKRTETRFSCIFQYEHQILPNHSILFDTILNVCIKTVESNVLLFEHSMAVTYNQET